MRLVVDSNVIISGLRFGGVPRQIVEMINTGVHEGFVSTTTMQEVEDVLLKKFKVSTSEWIVIGSVLRDIFIVIPTRRLPIVDELRDKRDAHILAASRLCTADCIITGDKDLLILEQYNRIPIVKPSDFFNNLGSIE